MKHITISLLMLVLTCIGLKAQSTLPDWRKPHPQILETFNKPNPTKFKTLVGVGGQNEIFSVPDNNQITTLRRFHLMELDFAEYYYPSEIIPPALDCGCDNPFKENDCVVRGGESCTGVLPGFSDNKNQTCRQRNQLGFSSVHAALDAINVRTLNGNCEEQQKIARSYPNKWYNGDEWGGTIDNIRANAAEYTENFAATFCPTDGSKPCLINVLEMGNEPWGAEIMTRNQYIAIFRGIVDGMRSYYGENPDTWRMKLSTPALQAYYPADAINQESYFDRFGVGPYQDIETMIPADIRPFIHYTNIHSYAFARETKFGTPLQTRVSFMPEDPEGGFLNFKNMVSWTKQNMPHARVNVTEFGWNSGIGFQDGCFNLGQAGQAAYVLRAYFLAARYGIEKAFNYRLSTAFDNETPLYCSTSLIDPQGTPKKSYQALNRFLEQHGDLRFLRVLTESYEGTGQNFVFLLGDEAGKPTHIVAWKSDELISENDYPAVSSLASIDKPFPFTLETAAAQYIGWDENQNINLANNKATDNGESIEVQISSLPILIPLTDVNCIIDAEGEILCDDDGGEIEEVEETCETSDIEDIESISVGLFVDTDFSTLDTVERNENNTIDIAIEAGNTLEKYATILVDGNIINASQLFTNQYTVNSSISEDATRLSIVLSCQPISNTAEIGLNTRTFEYEIKQEVEVPPLVAPINLRVVEQVGNSVRLAWDYDRTDIQYALFMNGAPIAFSSDKNIRVPNLQIGVDYIFTVKAQFGDEDSPFSEPLFFNLTDTEAPTTVSINISQVGFTSAAISWTPSTDQSGINFYEFYLNGILLQELEGLSFNLNNLEQNTSYLVSVIAVDNAGNRSETAFRSFVTIEQPLCEVGSQTNRFEHIRRFTLGDINNRTSREDNGYGDYSNLSATIKPNEEVPFFIRAFISGLYLENFAIWVDWNGDNQFTENENVWSRRTFQNRINSSFMVPSDVQPGRVRLRVAISYDQVPNACGIIEFGEYEDYTLDIAPDGIQNRQEAKPLLAIPAMDLEDETVNLDIKLYPNPATSLLHIKTGITFEVGTQIEIFSQVGQLLETRTIEDPSREAIFEVGSYQKGLYYARIITKDQQAFIHSFLVIP